MLLTFLSSELGLPESYLEKLSRSARHCYKHYQIPKRNMSGVRDIYHPSRKLKAVQRALLRGIISKFPVHDAAYGYRHGRCSRDNAKKHARQNFLLRLDLENFFGSIRRTDLQHYLSKSNVLPNDWTDEDTLHFSNFVCRGDSLVIGSPSSPALSNAICFELDTMLTRDAENNGVIYTRYADDLFFSTLEPYILAEIAKHVAEMLDSLKIPAALRINAAKTRHTSRKRTKRVTGLVITPEGNISLGRERKRLLSAQVHQVDKLSEDQRKRLAGWLAYCISAEPSFVDRLYQKYGASQVDKAMRPKKSGSHPK